VQNEPKVSRRVTVDLTLTTTERGKKRKLEDSEKLLPQGKRMVSASLKTEKVVQSKKKEENVAFGQDKTKTKSTQRQISVRQ